MVRVRHICVLEKTRGHLALAWLSSSLLGTQVCIARWIRLCQHPCRDRCWVRGSQGHDSSCMDTGWDETGFPALYIVQCIAFRHFHSQPHPLTFIPNRECRILCCQFSGHLTNHAHVHVRTHVQHTGYGTCKRWLCRAPWVWRGTWCVSCIIPESTCTWTRNVRNDCEQPNKRQATGTWARSAGFILIIGGACIYRHVLGVLVVTAVREGRSDHDVGILSSYVVCMYCPAYHRND